MFCTILNTQLSLLLELLLINLYNIEVTVVDMQNINQQYISNLHNYVGPIMHNMIHLLLIE